MAVGDRMGWRSISFCWYSSEMTRPSPRMPKPTPPSPSPCWTPAWKPAVAWWQLAQLKVSIPDSSRAWVPSAVSWNSMRPSLTLSTVKGLLGSWGMAAYSSGLGIWSCWYPCSPMASRIVASNWKSFETGSGFTELLGLQEGKASNMTRSPATGQRVRWETWIDMGEVMRYSANEAGPLSSSDDGCHVPGGTFVSRVNLRTPPAARRGRRRRGGSG